MKIYEFITPSDPITFKAKDDKIAFLVAVLLGNGKAGCTRLDENNNEVDLNTLLFISGGGEERMIMELGCKVEEFVGKNGEDIASAFESFSYGHLEDRKQYDDAIEAITDHDKLEEFKKKHEDRNRSSLSAWVKYAWDIGKEIKSNLKRLKK